MGLGVRWLRRPGVGARWPLLLLLTCWPGAAATIGQPTDSELTFVLPPGREDCFYQSADHNSSMEIEYQVIGGAGLDVDFTVISPNGEKLIAESRKYDGVHTIEPTMNGDYKICFDNSFSTISEKLIFFEVIFDDAQMDWSEIVEPDELLDIKIDDIKIKQPDFDGTAGGGRLDTREKMNVNNNRRDSGFGINTYDSHRMHLENAFHCRKRKLPLPTMEVLPKMLNPQVPGQSFIFTDVKQILNLCSLYIDCICKMLRLNKE
ncbi:transmembrane emp24 domain-containing protein 1-like isoform X1 [Narcine bancroftii]|uniref:transmembrane emp24 domain-containing protein 1-like isoform X1 n=1 Tax=Narcine bancroftii TaxID=1343680 RepID=UPI003831E5E8